MNLFTNNRKQLIILISSFFICFGCQQQQSQENKTANNPNGYSISGTIMNPKAEMIYLVDLNETVIDSSKIINNSFLLSGIVTEPNSYNLVFKSQVQPYSIIVENTDFNVLINQSDMMVIGGALNTKQAEYTRNETAFNTQRLTALEQYFAKKVTNKNLLITLDSISQSESQYTLDFIKINKDNLLSSTILDSKSLSLETLLAITDSTQNAKNTLLTSSLSKRIAILQKAEEDRIAAKKKATVKKEVWRAPAPKFSGQSLAGSNLALSSVLQGKKAVLVDFWASWCKPCRMVTPEVRYLYQKYNKRGFDIITVSEDRNQPAWRQGVQEDQMTAWNHIYDNQMNIARLYGANAIPHMVLIDEKGKIIKDKISISQLKRELSKIFK